MAATGSAEPEQQQLDYGSGDSGHEHSGEHTHEGSDKPCREPHCRKPWVAERKVKICHEKKKCHWETRHRKEKRFRFVKEWYEIDVCHCETKCKWITKRPEESERSESKEHSGSDHHDESECKVHCRKPWVAEEKIKVCHQEKKCHKEKRFRLVKQWYEVDVPYQHKVCHCEKECHWVTKKPEESERSEKPEKPHRPHRPHKPCKPCGRA